MEAASVPIAALTAWQGLFDHADLKADETLLVHGGAGAVGMFVVQIARRRGARVVATCSEPDLAFVSELGAHEVIDYRTTPFEDGVGAVDVVFDTVGGETLGRSWNVLRPSGRMVSVASQTATDESARAQSAFFIVEANGDQLRQVGELIDEGDLIPLVGRIVQLDDAAAAFAGRITKKQGRGKLVIAVSG